MALTSAESFSLGALAISCCSTLLAWRSLQNSNEALSISRGEQKQKSRSIRAYLVQALRVHTKREDIFISFTLSFTNTASVANTIGQLDLIIFYTDENGVLRETYLPSYHSVVLPDAESKKQQLLIPINIEARSTHTGSVSFKVSTFLLNKTIKKYQVSGLTSDLQKVMVECYILSDAILYENRNKP